jgi:WD40 repeat protein
MKLWDVETGKELGTLSGRTRDVYGVCFSPDGKTLAGSVGSTITLWGIAEK